MDRIGHGSLPMTAIDGEVVTRIRGAVGEAGRDPSESVRREPAGRRAAEPIRAGLRSRVLHSPGWGTAAARTE